VVGSTTREQLKAKMDRGEKSVLVDALSAKHYESSHLPGAVNLPYEFVNEAETVLPDKDADISFQEYKLAKKYLGMDKYPNHQPGDEQVVIFVRLKHTTQIGG